MYNIFVYNLCSNKALKSELIRSNHPDSLCVSVVFNLGCTLESPGGLSKNILPGPHLAPIF